MRQSLDDLMRKSVDPEHWDREPGLFRRWELEHLIKVGCEYRLEQWGHDEMGCELFALYQRRTNEDSSAPHRQTSSNQSGANTGTIHHNAGVPGA